MNREEFLAFQDLVIEPVFIKQMDATFHVRSLSAAEKAAWEQEPFVDVPKKGSVKLSRDRMRTARERLVEIATCNPDGSRYFKDGDASAIGRKNGKIVSELYDAAAKLSGITEDDLDEIIKNSESSPVVDSQSV